MCVLAGTFATSAASCQSIMQSDTVQSIAHVTTFNHPTRYPTPTSPHTPHSNVPCSADPAKTREPRYQQIPTTITSFMQSPTAQHTHAHMDPVRVADACETRDVPSVQNRDPMPLPVFLRPAAVASVASTSVGLSGEVSCGGGVDSDGGIMHGWRLLLERCREEAQRAHLSAGAPVRVSSLNPWRD